MFNSIGFYSFIENNPIYINVFLKMSLGLIVQDRIAFLSILPFVFNHTAAETNHTNKKEIN